MPAQRHGEHGGSLDRLADFLCRSSATRIRPAPNPSCEDFHQRGLGREVRWSEWSTLTGQPTHYLEPKLGILRLFPSPFRMMRCAFAFGAAMPLISSGAILPTKKRRP